jgi:nitrite reductase/ring-hydroxylating ferredoxin subunit
MQKNSENETIYPNGKPIGQQRAWRQDFPVDWPQDHYVARRDFTKFLVLASLAFVCGQFWIVIKNFIRKRQGLPPVQQLARLDQIPVGGVLPFNYPQEHDNCLLIRTSDSECIAFSQKCTHLGCAVVPDVKNDRLLCPCHKGIFQASTGRPLAGPPRRPLPRITLEIRNGVVYATGVEVASS